MKEELRMENEIFSPHLKTKWRQCFATVFLLCAFLLNARAQSPTCGSYGDGDAMNIVYTVNGSVVPDLSGVMSGDQVSVCFDVTAGSTPTIFTLVSYKAPAATFNAADADLQTIYQMDSQTFTTSGCLTIMVPSCFFQLDFVRGCAITQFGPQGSNNFYGSQGRLIAGLNGGSGSCGCVATADAGADLTLNCSSTEAMINGSTYTHYPLVSWTAVAGGNITAGSNTLSPTINASGTYILTVTDTLNCSMADTVLVSGHTNVLSPGIIGNPQSNCGPFIPAPLISIADATANPGETIAYQWLQSPVNVPNTPGNPYWSAISGATSAGYTPGLISSTTYFVRCSRTIGCTFVGPTTETPIIGVTILPVPSVDLGSDITIGSCAGSVMIDAGNSGASFVWNTGASTEMITASAAGNYYVTVTNSDNCSASDSVNVMGGGSVTVDLGADITLCAGGSVMLDAGNAGALFSWSTGASTQMISVNTSGSIYVTVTSGSCSVSDTVNVTVLPALTVDLGADITASVCAGPVTLDAGNSGMLYLWGNAAVSQTIGVTASGMYYVTVTNAGGCSASDSINVTLTPPSLSVDLGINALVCAGGSITLDAGNSGLSFNWSTGATSQMITVSASGTYGVTVTDGSCSVSDSIDVTVLPLLNVDLGSDTTVVLCTGSITIDAGNAGMTYLWNTGAISQSISASASGTYYVTVTNAGGCTVSDSINITVVPGSLSINIGNDTSYMTCTHETLTLDAGVSGTYMWNTGLTTQTLVVASSGTYYVNVTDNLGCMASDTINVNITDNTIDLDLGPDTTVCGCISLNAGVSGATSYMWCSGQTYPAITACSSGMYCVTVGNGTCMAHDSIMVTMNTAPTVNLGSDTTLLLMGTFTLNAGNAGLSYAWSTGETTQMISVTATGVYYVTVTDVYGCTGTDTIHVNFPIGIAENTLAAFDVNVFPNPSGGDNVTLSFNCPDCNDVEIRILNVLGRVVYSEKLSSFKGNYRKILPVNDLADGIYFANVQKGETSSITKFTVQK